MEGRIIENGTLEIKRCDEFVKAKCIYSSCSSDNCHIITKNCSHNCVFFGEVLEGDFIPSSEYLSDEYISEKYCLFLCFDKKLYFKKFQDMRKKLNK